MNAQEGRIVAMPTQHVTIHLGHTGVNVTLVIEINLDLQPEKTAKVRENSNYTVERKTNLKKAMLFNCLLIILFITL